MTGDIESAAVSVATTPATAGTTDLTGCGSHFANTSPPPPEIRVLGEDDPFFEKNGDFIATNAQLEVHIPLPGLHNADDARSQDSHANQPHAPGRARSDSLWPTPRSEDGIGPSGDSSASNHGIDTGSEDDGVTTPLTRRCSMASQTNTALELTCHSTANYDSSESGSAPVFTDESSYDSDFDPTRPYTTSLKLPQHIIVRSRGNSVVSDGGEQDFLESRKLLGTRLELPQVVTRSSAGAKSQRYALQKQIYATMEIARDQDTSLPGQQFFPKDQLSRVINPAAVFTELVHKLEKTHSTEQIRHCANSICCATHTFARGRWREMTYRSIFAILVLAERSQLILSFMDEEVSDLDLPLVPIMDSGSISGMQRRDMQPNGVPWPPLRCFDSDDWSPASLAHFDRQQWNMLAPFFSLGRSGQIKHYPLHDRHILPFVVRHKAEEDAAEAQGGYGKVFMVHLHPAHHRLAGDTYADRGFAVKQLLVNDRKSFRKERRMLKRFSGTNGHPHIVSLLATYSHRSKYHFIFNRAQSDLVSFWQKYEQRLEMSHSDVCWIAEQCQGLADGLFKIHRHKTFKVRRVDQHQEQGNDVPANSRVTFAEVIQRTDKQLGMGTHEAIDETAAPIRSFSSEIEGTESFTIKHGRHGDINPQNILLFDDDLLGTTTVPRQLRGTLKIADFGTAEMHSTYSRSGVRDVANTMTYRPPECDAADRTIRQSFDIWCLGCVFLEFATWMLGGEALVRRFAKKRLSRDMTCNSYQTDTYFELIWNKDDQRIEARVKPSVVTFVDRLHRMPRCTDFLHDLLTLIMHDMLVVNSQERVCCRDLRKKLRQMRIACQSQSYSLEATQWRNGEHVKPETFLRSHEVKLSEEAQRQVERNLPFDVITSGPT